jgi:hypothetical protein
VVTDVVHAVWVSRALSCPRPTRWLQQVHSLLPDEQPTAASRRALSARLTCQVSIRPSNAGDRTYLVLAKPNLIPKDIRLLGLALAGREAAGQKSPRKHAQTAQNL